MVIKQKNFWGKIFSWLRRLEPNASEQQGSPWHTAALVFQCMWHLVDICLSNSPRHVRTRCERNFSQGSLVKRFYNSDKMTWKRWRSTWGPRTDHISSCCAWLSSDDGQYLAFLFYLRCRFFFIPDMFDEKKKMKVLRILSFSRLWRYWMAIISFFLSPSHSRARFESGTNMKSQPTLSLGDRKVSLTSQTTISVISRGKLFQ